MFIVEEIQRTPQDLFLQPHGVLHVVTISCHMEYSIWLFFGVIWSALGLNSERSNYIAIWSTPYGCFMMPYGVLHMARNLRVYGVLHTVVKNVYY